MSKSDGLKIGIKFTEDLVGDVSGNESAFSVTGKEYKYVNGVLIDKDYQVAKVDRYPVPVLHEDDFIGGIVDGVEVGGNGLVLEAELSPALEFDGNDYVTIPFTTEKAEDPQTFECWVYLDEIAHSSIDRYFCEAYPDWYPVSLSVKNDNKLTLYYKNSSNASTTIKDTNDFPLQEWMHVAVAKENGNIKLYRNGMLVGSSTDNQYVHGTANGLLIGTDRTGSRGWKGKINEVRYWSTVRTQQEIQDNMNTELTGYETGLSGYWKMDEGTGGTTADSAGSNNGTINGAVWQADARGAGYNELGTHAPPPIDATTLPTNPRIKYETDLPASTSITVEYAINQSVSTTPLIWTEVENGELLTIPQTEGHFLWLKYTLETTDTAVTPTLKRVWLEESSAPQDKILITMDWWGRFNNVEDKIKVLYDASKGGLTGAGGAVESFETSFTPEDLVQTPNPNEEELIKAYPYEIVLDLNEVTFINAYSQEYVKAYPYEIVLELKHVSEINP